MSQRFIPADFYRGGSSKGVVFAESVLPPKGPERDRLLLEVLGSPDPYRRQLDGMGGGISSLSKAVIIGPPTREGCDVDYTFGQVSVDRATVDWGANCGNMSSVIGPYAVDHGLVGPMDDGEALVRVHQVNTRRVIHSRFQVRDGKAVVTGDTEIAGVSGSGARIALDFLSPGGAITGRLLPSGRAIDQLTLRDGRFIEATLVDASNPVVFVAAADLGLSGVDAPDALEARAGLLDELDGLRRQAAVLMGLAATPEAAGLANPKIAMVAAPADFATLDGRAISADAIDLAVRMLSMERVHRAVTLTGAMCTAVAVRLDGSLPARVARRVGPDDDIRVGNPSGVVGAGAVVRDGEAVSASVIRTARLLMRGEVAVRA